MILILGKTVAAGFIPRIGGTDFSVTSEILRAKITGLCAAFSPTDSSSQTIECMENWDEWKSDLGANKASPGRQRPRTAAPEGGEAARRLGLPGESLMVESGLSPADP